MTHAPEPATPIGKQTAHRRLIAVAKGHSVAAALAIAAITITILTAANGAQNEPGPHGPRRSTTSILTATPTSRPTGPTPSVPSRVQPKPQRHTGRAAVATGRLWPRGAHDAARRFLATYLLFTYAHIPASEIRAASRHLRAHLAANPPEVPEQVQRLHPRVTTLAIIPARIVDAGIGWAATATVTDGLESYQITVKVTPRRRRWLVTSLLPP